MKNLFKTLTFYSVFLIVVCVQSEINNSDSSDIVYGENYSTIHNSEFTRNPYRGK